MRLSSRSRRLAAAASVAISIGGLAIAAPATAAGPIPRTGPLTATAPPAAGRVPALPLGPADLVQVQSTSTLTPGVTLTDVTRGAVDRHLRWTIELAGASTTSGDPDASGPTIQTRRQAGQLAAQLRAKGYVPRIEKVFEPKHTDAGPGLTGYRVRVGSYRQQGDTTAVVAAMTAAGFHPTARYTGWDESATVRGPWHLEVLTIDPTRFRGELETSYGTDLRNAEKPSAVATSLGAIAATNASFFVFHADDSDQGTPAGIGVYGGKLLSEPRNNRPGFAVHANGTAAVDRYDWRGSVTVGTATSTLDGLNRAPGIVMNCGEPGETPTVFGVCNPADNLVEITPEFGSITPTGPGAEAVVDATGHIARVASTRGTTLTAGQVALQGIGADAATVAGWRVGEPVKISTTLLRNGRAYRPSATTWIAAGQPQLVTHGKAQATIKRDAMDASWDPSSSYGFNNERNPRTLVGVDRAGRTVIVTCDGRTTTDLGLTIGEEAEVSKALGLVNAMNLDGGGSTSMSVDGHVITHPSDATGERPTGDALVVLPAQR